MIQFTVYAHLQSGCQGNDVTTLVKWKKCFFQLCRARPSLGDKGLKPKTITPLSISLKVCITFRFHSLAWNKSWSSQQAPIYLKNASSNNILHTFLSAHIVLKIDGIILSSYSMLFKPKTRKNVRVLLLFKVLFFFSHAMAKMIWRSNMEKSTIEKALQAFYFNCCRCSCDSVVINSPIVFDL